MRSLPVTCATIVAAAGLLFLHSRQAGAQSPASSSATPASSSAPLASADTPHIKEKRGAGPDKPTLIPHDLAGRAACSTCHGPAGKHPYPQDHNSRPDSACLACHVPARSAKAPSPNTPVGPTVTDSYCLSCHGNPELKMTLAGGAVLSLFVDKDVYYRSMHGRKSMACAACHPRNQDYPHPRVIATAPRELSRGIAQQRCVTCHQTQYDQYRESVHGRALLSDGNLDVPACTDCHGVHNMRDTKTALFRLESPDTCSVCHSDPVLTTKYNLSPNVVRTYLSDFHGTSIRLARAKNPNINSYKAVCYDCHGVHDIKKVDAADSMVVKENLVKTCQRCHAGADTNFPAAWTSHYDPDSKRFPIVYYVNWGYKLLIPGVIGPMVGYILLEMMRHVINKLKGVKHG